MGYVQSPNRAHDRQLFYKYVRADIAKLILRSQTLRWSSPTLFNDPFDVPRRLSFDYTPREVQHAVAEELARMIETGCPIPAAAPTDLRYLLKILLDAGDSPSRKAVVSDLRTEAMKHIPEPLVGFSGLQSFWDQLIPTMRILCISERPDSAPMWAHYADYNQGVVLEFEVVDAVDSALLLAKSVIYQPGAPRLPSKAEWVRSLTGQCPIDFKNLFKEYQLVKESQWSYEHEWRIVSYGGGDETGAYSDYPFAHEELRRVIVGASCSGEDEREIGDILSCGYPNAVVARATWDHDARRIIV